MLKGVVTVAGAEETNCVHCVHMARQRAPYGEGSSPISTPLEYIFLMGLVVCTSIVPVVTFPLRFYTRRSESSSTCVFESPPQLAGVVRKLVEKTHKKRTFQCRRPSHGAPTELMEPFASLPSLGVTGWGK